MISFEFLKSKAANDQFVCVDNFVISNPYPYQLVSIS